MSLELILKYFLEPFVFTAVAVTAGGLSIFLLFKFPSDRDSGRVNKESKKVSGSAGRGWCLEADAVHVYCDQRPVRARARHQGPGETSGHGAGVRRG